MNPIASLLLLIALLIYLASMRKMWKYYHNSYSKGGQFENINASGSDVFFTYCPFANTIAALCEWNNDGTRAGNKRNEKSYNKTFNIVKPTPKPPDEWWKPE